MVEYKLYRLDTCKYNHTTWFVSNFEPTSDVKRRELKISFA